MFDFQSPSFSHTQPMLYYTIRVCLSALLGDPQRKTLQNLHHQNLYLGCFNPPTLETCWKYNHIIISAKFWSNSNTSFLVMYNNIFQVSKVTMFDFHVFPTILDDFKRHEFTHGGFLQTFGTNQLPKVSKRFQGVGPIWGRIWGIFPISVDFTPLNVWSREH